MNYRFIFSIIGFLIASSGVAMLLGIPFSIYYNDKDIIPILYSSLISIIVGLGFWHILKPKTKELCIKDGFLIVSIGWIAISLFGSLPYILSGSIPSLTDAIFETVSGFTTTGASILIDVEKLPHGVLFWRSMTHWLGGMGIVILSLAILPLLGVAGMQLYKAEAAGPTKDKLTPRITETARLLWSVYLLLTVTEIVLLLIGGMNLFDAVCHAFGTIATGGFSTKNASIAHYNSPYIEFIIGVFMFLSAVNFGLHYASLKGDPLNYFRNSEFKFFFTLIACSIIIVAGINFIYNPTYNLIDSIRFSFFNVISISSCTGFATADFAQWAPSAQLLLIILMFFGGCAGSTAGGIKNVRVFLLLRNTFAEVKRIIHPRAVVPIKFNNKLVDPEILSVIAAFFVLYITIFSASSLMLMITGVDLVSAISGVASCMGGVGPGLNTVGPMSNYSALPMLAKWILCGDMLLGRLELFTVMVIFTKMFWKV